MFVASCRAATMAVALKTKELTRILDATNRLLTKDSEANAMFVTFFASILDPEKKILSYSNAGHNPPLIYRKEENRIIELPFSGTALGIFDDSVFTQQELSLEVGDIVYYYTDGVVEARNLNGEFYGKERLCEDILRLKNLSSEEIVNSLTSSLLEFTGEAKQYDDITMVVLKRTV